MKEKKLNNSEWKEKYYNERNIKLKENFNEQELQVLKKLGIELEDKLYTNYEYECIEIDIFAYCDDKDKLSKEDIEITKPLPKGVSKEEYKNVFEKFCNSRK